MSLIDDHELRRRFAELREADRATASSVDAILGHARPSRRSARRIYAATVVLGTAALAVLVISSRHRDAGQPPVIVGIMEWRPMTDVLLACVFSPEEVMMHQGEIGLQDDQRTKLASDISRAQAKSTEIQWTLSGEQQKLEQLLRAATLDEVAVLKEVDRILSLEQEMKRTQLRPGQPAQWDRPRQQNRPGCR